MCYLLQNRDDICFSTTFQQDAPSEACVSCRFVLQPGMLPEEARLAHDLLQLRLKAAALEEVQCRSPAVDFADLLLLVNGVCFRSVPWCPYPSAPYNETNTVE